MTISSRMKRMTATALATGALCTGVLAPLPTASAYAVTNLYSASWGHQEAIDLCYQNAFVRDTAVEPYMDAPYLAAHNYCGGDIILGLHVGDIVTMSGLAEGTFRVAGWVDVPRYGATTADIPYGYAAYAQTCYYNSEYMRVMYFEYA